METTTACWYLSQQLVYKIAMLGWKKEKSTLFVIVEL